MNILSQRSISRRSVLKGIGASVALPFLDCMLPAKEVSRGPKTPQRFAWIYIPNGVVQEAWHPKKTGLDWEVTPSLTPLKEFRSKVNVFTGLDRKFRGGTGVHAQAGCCWLTSSPPSEALDGGFPTNTTLDQLIAKQIGQETYLPSMELSCNDFTNQKETRYFETISWKSPGYASEVQKDPRAIFSRLFEVTKKNQKGVLDLISQDAKNLLKRVGKSDQSKITEYLDSVREIETRIEKAEGFSSQRQTKLQRPQSIPEERGAYLQLMADLIAIAFQQDLTRVTTLVIDPERWDTPRSYHGVFSSPQNHHVLTHTKGEEALEKLKKIDRFHVEQFAYLVKKLDSISEGGKSLLDQSLLSFGSGMGDGRIHDYGDLPLITAGSLGGKLKTGEHHKFKGYVPLANLWLTQLQAAGAQSESFADGQSTIGSLLT